MKLYYLQNVAIVFLIWIVLPTTAHVFRFPMFFEPNLQENFATPITTTPEPSKATTVKIHEMEAEPTTEPTPITTPEMEKYKKGTNSKGLTFLEEAKIILRFIRMKIEMLEKMAK